MIRFTVSAYAGATSWARTGPAAKVSAARVPAAETHKNVLDIESMDFASCTYPIRFLRREDDPLEPATSIFLSGEALRQPAGGAAVDFKPVVGYRAF
jgi:hypothetical protein